MHKLFSHMSYIFILLNQIQIQNKSNTHKQLNNMNKKNYNMYNM